MRRRSAPAIFSLMLAVSLFHVPAARTGILTPEGTPDAYWQSNAMLLWLKADAGVTKDPSNNVSAWQDQSTYGYTVGQSTPANQPQWAATTAGLTSPAILWDGNARYMLVSPTTGPVNQQTMFIVYKDVSTEAYVTPVGTVYDGAYGSYHGHSGATQLFSSTYTDPKTRAGGNYCNGHDIGNGLTTGRPTTWALDAHVATAPLGQRIATIGADNGPSLSPNRDINGGIAEILVYNRPLDLFELNQVGYYLEKKYGLSTAYTYVPPTAVADSATEFSGTQGTMNWQYGKYNSLTGTTFSALTQYSTSPATPTLQGNPGPHWSVAGSYPKMWNDGVHPDASAPAVRRWTSEVTGVVKICGDLAKFDTAGGDGVRGDVRVNGARHLAQAIAANDGTGIHYTTYARVQAGQPVDLVVNPLGNQNNDSTRFTATIEAIPESRIVDLADVVGGGNGHGTGEYPGGYAANTGIFATTTGSGSAVPPAGFKSVSPANALIDGVFIAKRTTDGATQITSTGINVTVPDVTGNGAYFNIRNFLGTAGNNQSTLDGIDYNNAGGHRMIAIHPNQGITFDLDAIERANGGLAAEFFSAVAGLSTANTTAQSGFAVYVDGVSRYSYNITNSAEIGLGIPINIALNPSDRFLTLVSVDYNGLASGGIMFGDPIVILGVPEPASLLLGLMGGVVLAGATRVRRIRRR